MSHIRLNVLNNRIKSKINLICGFCGKCDNSYCTTLKG